MKRLVLPSAFLLVILTVGCAPVENTLPEEKQQHTSQYATGSQADIVVEETAAIGEVMEQEQPTLIPMQERLLSSGYLEIGTGSTQNTLLIYTEHHCKYCKEFWQEQYPTLRDQFLSQGTLRVHIAILPLEKYAQSTLAAKAFFCAAKQGKGSAMHSMLFDASSIDRSSIETWVTELELHGETFSSCIDGEEAEATINTMKQLAQSLDVSLVPTFFLNGKKSIGLPYWEDLEAQIRNL